MAKFFRLKTDNSNWFAGESVFSEPLMERMLRELPESESKVQVFEEITKDEAYEESGYFLVSAADFTGNYGEKNVFHDVNGNEWHN